MKIHGIVNNPEKLNIILLKENQTDYKNVLFSVTKTDNDEDN